jgi:hypothetical protein
MQVVLGQQDNVRLAEETIRASSTAILKFFKPKVRIVVGESQNWNQAKASPRRLRSIMKFQSVLRSCSLLTG